MQLSDGSGGFATPATSALNWTSGVLTVNGEIDVPGTTDHTYEWDEDTGATDAVIVETLPLIVFGSGTHLLGNPAKWVLVKIDGVHYVMPVYSLPS